MGFFFDEGCCSFCTTTVRKWMSFSFLLLGFILFIVGFSTEYWSYIEDISGDESFYGLWRSCTTSAGVILCSDFIGTGFAEGWLKVVQAFETVALVFLFAGFVTMLVYNFAQSNKVTRYLTISLILCAAIFIVVGLVVFGVEADKETIDSLGFSFYFVIVSAFFVLVGLGFFMLIEVDYDFD